MSHHTVTLASETDSIGFRREARSLLAALVAPDQVDWRVETSSASDALRTRGGRTATRKPGAQGASNLLLPRSFLTLCETVILHNGASRFSLLYRLLWRLVHEPDLHRNPLDADRVLALHLAQAVRRDMHKMKTLVQFTNVDPQAGAEGLHLAWFSPDHHIVEAMAPSLARRLNLTSWALLTPQRSVRWHDEQFEFGRGTRTSMTSPVDNPLVRWRGVYLEVFGDEQAEHPGSGRLPRMNAETEGPAP